MSADEGQEEYEEVQADLRKKEEEVIFNFPSIFAYRNTIKRCNIVSMTLHYKFALLFQAEKNGTDAESGIVRTPQRRLLYTFFSRVFVQSLTLTFLAEWGDRSQIATIILGAREASVLIFM